MRTQDSGFAIFPVIHQLFTLLLSELDHPQHTYLIEPLEKHLTFKVTTEGGEEVSQQQQQVFVHGLVNKFVETTVALSESYGIVEVKEGGVVITPIGKCFFIF